jgi:hypothetical protein
MFVKDEETILILDYYGYKKEIHKVAPGENGFRIVVKIPTPKPSQKKENLCESQTKRE